MEGNSNSATLTEHRPASLLTERTRHVSFRGPAAVNDLEFAWSDEQFDELHTNQCPLSVAGFVRLGELNRSSSTARRDRKHRGSFQEFNDDVLAPAHVESSFRPPESIVDESSEIGGEVESRVLAVGSSLFTSANTSALKDTPGATPEVDRNSLSAAINEDSAPDLKAAANADPSPTAAEQHPFQQLQQLSKRVKAGDDSAIAEIQRILDSNDALWRHLGDVERTTEAMLIEFAAGTADVKESVRRSVVAMKQSLLGEQPTPLERMAVGRVVACWLFAHFVDRWCGWSVKQGSPANGLAKLLEASEKRYQVSLRSLKLVQGIKSPTV